MHCYMGVDGNVKPSDELIDASIDTMRDLFKSEGYDCTITKAPEGFVRVECATLAWQQIERIASCIGGDGWSWIPISFVQQEELWKQMQEWGEV